MNAIQETKEETTKSRSITQVCADCYKKIVTRIEKVKSAVIAEFRDTLAVNEQMLKLAVNEAEALAWETDYPQLFFPTLAAEKAREVANWSARQRSMFQLQPAYARAA